MLILMEYITNVLAPKQYRLELKNRLENLCSLSGSPMSPGLREWVIRTFGLEMVRVLESYSSLTPPVFSPSLQQKINTIVPTNYQGADVNLMFRQQFDVTCTPAACLYSAYVQDTTCTGFNNIGPNTWDFNGFGTSYGLYSSSIGGYAVPDGNPTCLPEYEDFISSLSFCYIGASAPPDFIVTDPLMNVTTYSYSAIACTFGCVKTNSIRLSNSPYGWLFLQVFGILNTNPNNYGLPLDFLDLTTVESTLNTIIRSYQPGSSCNVIDDGGGFCTIQFNNVYYNPSGLAYGIGLVYDIGLSNSQENYSLSPCP